MEWYSSVLIVLLLFILIFLLSLIVFLYVVEIVWNSLATKLFEIDVVPFKAIWNGFWTIVFVIGYRTCARIKCLRKEKKILKKKAKGVKDGTV